MKSFGYLNSKILRAANVQLPNFDKDHVKKETKENPRWMHFGGGNLYRAFHAEIAQELIEKGELSSGIVVCETFDEEMIDQIYQPYDNDFLEVIMHENGDLEKKLISATVESYYCHPSHKESYHTVKSIFSNPSLQIVTVTITEKGYMIYDPLGKLTPIVESDIKQGPHAVEHTMSMITSLLWERYQKNQAPLALASTDNFSNNGYKFKQSIIAIAQLWKQKGDVDQGFIEYLENEEKISFPWTMIDRITPNPAVKVAQALNQAGIDGLQILKTRKGTNIAAFANTEKHHYLVMEDNFPNGRPDLSKAGVILTDRKTVEKADAMKVTVCLNPLHTTLAVYGCLFGYATIAEAMKDPELLKLIKGVGYKEGLPVVINPQIIDPKEFLDELIQKRLTNPMIPDTPQRIATDTSQKIAIRFGETIQKYVKNPNKNSHMLVYIPLAIAGWLRYLVGIDDKGQKFELSPDPFLTERIKELEDVEMRDSEKILNIVKPILENQMIMGVDLYQTDLGRKIETYLKEMLQGNGSVRETLNKYTREF